MIKELMKSIREYKRDSILTPILVSLEVVMECIIPFVVAQLVNEIKAGSGMGVISRYGLILVVMALMSLAFGAGAGSVCASASCGFAKNLRKDMFYRIQDFSFENIDKFSTSSLVTRMTTDVIERQLAFIDADPTCDPQPADVDLFLYDGVYYGRKDGADSSWWSSRFWGSDCLP